MSAQVSAAISAPSEGPAQNGAQSQAAAAQRPTRSLRPSAGQNQRSSQLGRSRTPSELLARKQRLLNGVAATGSGGANLDSTVVSAAHKLNLVVASSPERTTATAATAPSGAQVSRSQSGERPSRSTTSTTSTTLQLSTSTAESKLESLSQLLMQQNQANALMSIEIEANKQQVSNGATTTLASSSSAAGASMASSSSSLALAGAVSAATAANNVSGAIKSIDDVYILLAKKEKDLQLAAELGKALLERNEELSKTNEHLAEDYSHRLEVSARRRLALFLAAVRRSSFKGAHESD